MDCKESNTFILSKRDERFHKDIRTHKSNINQQKEN